MDSTQQTEDLGSNAVEATRLGLRNLERVAGYLVNATSKPGKDYELLDVEYGALLAQWRREMGHVANVVGGVQEINLYYGDATRRFFPNSADYQQQAVSFLLEQALTTPTNFTAQDIVGRLSAEGTAERVLAAQTGVLDSLISGRRIARLAEIEQTSTNATYSPAKLFSDPRGGLFRELSRPVVEIDLYRRNLQRSYIDLLSANLKNPPANSDLPAYSRGELEAIRELIRKSDVSRARPIIQMHFKDLSARISRALDPRLPVDSPAEK